MRNVGEEVCHREDHVPEKLGFNLEFKDLRNKECALWAGPGVAMLTSLAIDRAPNLGVKMCGKNEAPVK